MRRNREDVEDVEPVEYVKPRRSAGKLKLSLILTLLTLIGFVLFAIFADSKPIGPSDSENRAVDEFSEQNGEIIHPTEENATEGQDLRHFVINDDGGVWVIEALIVPEEWKK